MKQHMTPMFTIDQVRNYVEGWLSSSTDTNNLTINEIKAMLNNALVCLEDHNDGIGSYVERMDFLKNKTLT
jgi:hypothetical protein